MKKGEKRKGNDQGGHAMDAGDQSDSSTESTATTVVLNPRMEGLKARTSGRTFMGAQRDRAGPKKKPSALIDSDSDSSESVELVAGDRNNPLHNIPAMPKPKLASKRDIATQTDPFHGKVTVGTSMRANKSTQTPDVRPRTVRK